MIRQFFAALLLVSGLSVARAGEAEVLTLSVPGMTCSVCPITVRKALSRVPGVLDVKVDYEGKTAAVRVDPDRVQPEALMDATARAGYPSSLVTR